jgi:membrane protein implicated in regulation of membrane protease activity
MVLLRLVGLVVATALTALVAGGPLWWTLATLAVVALAAYVLALRRIKVRRDRAGDVVQLHPTRRARDAARRMVEQAARASADRSRALDARSQAG